MLEKYMSHSGFSCNLQEESSRRSSIKIVTCFYYNNKQMVVKNKVRKTQWQIILNSDKESKISKKIRKDNFCKSCRYVDLYIVEYFLILVLFLFLQSFPLLILSNTSKYLIVTIIILASRRRVCPGHFCG